MTAGRFVFPRRSSPPAGSRRAAFAAWRRERPFWGALLIALGGVEEFFSGQLDIGEIHIQLGLEGLQALVIPAVLVLLAVLIVTMPVHRIFYGVIALVVSIYSLVGVNLGGFIIGMVLATVGGIMVVSWMPKATDPDPGHEDDQEQDPAQSVPDPASEEPEGDAPQGGVPGWARGFRTTALSITAVAALVLGASGSAPAQAAEVRTGCVLLIICSPDPTPTPTPEATTPAPAEPAPTTSAPAEPTPAEPVPTTSAPSEPTAPAPTESSAPSQPDSGDDTTTDPTQPQSGDAGDDAEDRGDGKGSTIIEVPGQDRPSHPEEGEEPVTEDVDPSDLTTGTPLLALGDDNDHGIFTLPSANTSGSTMQIEGLKRVGLVTVPLADGTRATTIRIECDALIIDDFQLDTLNRPEVVDLDTGGMTLRGNVVVWIDRVGTIFDEAGGLEGSLDSNPLALEPLMTLLGQGHLVLGLVGAQADELSYESFLQRAWKQ